MYNIMIYIKDIILYKMNKKHKINTMLNDPLILNRLEC